MEVTHFLQLINWGQCIRVGILKKYRVYVSSFNHGLFFKNIHISRKIKVCLSYRYEGEFPAIEFIILKSVFNCVLNMVSHDDLTE